MKPFAVEFYKSQAWKDCRAAYLKSRGGLCERCLREGKYTPAVIIHHKVNITPENICDPTVTLNWGNLEAVCRLCHAATHGKTRRYKVDAAGRVTIL